MDLFIPDPPPPRPLINLFDHGSQVKMADFGGREVRATSVGAEEEREFVRNNEGFYDSVVSLQDTLTAGNCTATIVDVHGYEALNEGTILVTAAHCVDEGRPSDYLITGSFYDDGAVQRFHMGVENAWVHPHFAEYNRQAFGEGMYDHRADVAFLYTTDPVPSEVQPALFYPIDIHTAEVMNGGDLSERYLTMAGFSGDRIGLSVHESVPVIGTVQSVFVTEGDLAPGASGGPSFIATEDQPIAVTAEGQPVVAAVNSGIQLPNDDQPNPERGFATVLDEEMLSTVNFLEPAVGPPGEFCMPPIAEVTSDNGLNMRYGPGTDHPTLPEIDGASSALPLGSRISIDNIEENALGEVWGLATSEDGRVGYVAMEYTQEVSEEICFTP